jgi:iron(III) transport system substrate-binding protein
MCPPSQLGLWSPEISGAGTKKGCRYMKASRAFALAAASGLLLAGCGGGSSASGSGVSVAKAAKYTGSDRQAFLEKCAKDEGSLSVYTAQNTDLWGPLRTGFMKKYPGIKVSTTRRTSGDTAEAITKESGANVNKFDVADLKVEVSESLLNQFASYTSPQLAAYPKDAIGTDGKYVTSDRIPYGIVYNTDKVSAADAPKTSQDLLDPKWKGQIAMSTTLLGMQWVGWMDAKYGDGFIKAFGKQDVHTTAANGNAITAQVAGGEALVAPAVDLAGVETLKAAGKKAPIKWLPIDSQWTEGSLSISAKAPHPCAAMLYIDYELSKEGQTINPLYLSARTDVEPNPAVKGIDPVDIWQIVGKHDATTYLNASKRWTQLIDQYIIK